MATRIPKPTVATPPAKPAAGVTVDALKNEAQRLSSAVDSANANHNGFLTKTEAAALPSEFKDNYDNFRKQTGSGVASTQKLKQSFADYVAQSAAKADANKDGVIDATEAKNLAPDLQDNYAALAAANQSGGKSGSDLAKALKTIAPKLTLTWLGEDDSGGAAQVAFAKGPFAKADSGNIGDVFNQAFGHGKIKSENLLIGQSYPPGKQGDLWQSFKDYDDSSSDAADAASKLFEGATIYQVTVDTSRAFGGKAYLVAQMADGSLVGLKGDVAGMGF